MTTAYPVDDITHQLFMLLWLLVVIWVQKMADCGRGHLKQKPLRLCRSQANSKNARQITVKVGDRYGSSDGNSLSCGLFWPHTVEVFHLEVLKLE